MYDTIAEVKTEHGGTVGFYRDKDKDLCQIRVAAPCGAMYDFLTAKDMDELITQLMERY